MFAPVPSRLLFLGALGFLVGFAISVSGDTYSAWKARVFTDTEQADPAISGELALSPAADGIPNLLKYAFSLDPHKDGSLALPQLSLMEIADPESSQPRKIPAITYRVSSTDYPSDLYFVPEISFDLQQWRRGETFFDPPIYQMPANASDPTFVTCRALLSVSENSKAFLRVRVFEGQTLPDDWQIANFGHTGVDPNGDADGDGVSNFDEFLHGTDPNDYESRIIPELTIVSGDNQQGDPSSLLSLPLVVKVTQKGQSVVNAPVQFSVPPDSGLLSLSPSGNPSSATLTARTNFDGLATAYFRLPSIPLTAITISISSGGASVAMSESTNAGQETPSPTISIVSGNNQAGLPGQYLQDPFVVRLLDSDGQPVVGAAIVFSVSSGGGKLAVDRFASPPADSVTVISDNEGLAWTYYLQGADSGMLSQVSAASDAPVAHASFAATSVAYGPTTPRPVAAGAYHTLACYPDGTVWAWGYNGYGQLGDETTNDHWHREQVIGLANAVSVSTHADTSAALRSDGTVWTWGRNVDHALGDGDSAANSTTPVQVLQGVGAPLTNVVAVASGYSHVLALKADGTVWAWGSDWAYQLGNTSENASAFAVPVLMANSSPLQNVAAIACGDDHNLALKADGTVWTWGYNGDDELGTGDSDWRRASPAPVSGLTNVVAIASGGWHSLALKSDGTVWSWGANWEGAVGDGTTGNTRPAPVQAHNISSVIAIAAGNLHSLALRSDGSVWAWGDNSYGQLAVASSVQQYSALAIQVGGLAGIISLSAGGDHSFGVAANGSLLGWGSNFAGELGIRSQTDYVVTPRPVVDFLLAEDPDHDGLATWKEQKLGGDPNLYSTIGDTISDGWKAQYNFSLTDVGLAARDLMNKGLTILQDFQLGTNPTKFSTVDDGIADGWKARYQLDPLDPALADKDLGKGWAVRMDYQLGTDPTRISTLNDGIPDKWKVDHNVNPLDSGYANSDDDQDGLSNAEEYGVGTDPDNPDTDGDGVVDGQDGFALDPDLHPPRLPNQSYAVIDLGDGFARAINNKNQVVGEKMGVFFWDKGERKDFDPSWDDRADAAVGINDNGVALFDHINGPPTLWHSDNGTETPLQLYNGSSFQFDPNIVFSALLGYNGAGISNSGYVAAWFTWRGSYGAGGEYWSRAAIWTTDHSSAVLLDTVPDANDRVLSVDDRYDHGFRKDYENTVDSYNFHGHYDNTHGLDNVMYGIAMNNSDQIVATTINIEGVDPWGFPYSEPSFHTVTLWTNNQPEIVVRDLAARAYGINDDTIIAGTNSAGHIVLWVKVNGAWKEKDLEWALPDYNIRLNKNLQIISGHLLSQNNQLSNLLTRIGPQYSNLYAAGINEAGVIVGQADISAGNTVADHRAVILVPVELLVDGNRDGRISIDDASTHDRDITSPEKPYRFWLNDDDDTEQSYDGESYSADETEKVPAPRPDYQLHQIVSKRNLEDFARLWIHIGGLQDAIASGNIQIGLRWKNVTPGTTPAINIYPSADGEGSDNYLRDENAAQAQISGVFNDAVRDKFDRQTVDASAAFIFKSDYWNGLTAENPKKCLLFEGAGEGKGELEIVFFDQSGSEIGSGGSLWLDLVNIERMYERAKASPENISNPHESTTTPTAPPVSWVFDPNGNQWDYPRVSWAETNEYIVFVHGWNTSYDDARIFFADTMFKRLWQRGYRGRFAALYWPTIVGDFTYNDSEYRAWFYGESLRQYVNSLPTGYTKNVVAHSMGNIVAGSALRKGMNVANYAMLNAAVPASCYDNNPNLEVFAHSPDDDSDPPTLAMAYKDKFASVNTNLISFYLATDDALGKWDVNNTYFKPQAFYEAADGDHAYKYFPGNPSGQKLFLSFVLSPSRTLQLMEESLAYAAKSSTKTIGAEGNARGSIAITIDEASNYHYQNEHSGFWAFTLQRIKPAYDRFMDELGVEHNL